MAIPDLVPDPPSKVVDPLYTAVTPHCEDGFGSVFVAFGSFTHPATRLHVAVAVGGVVADGVRSSESRWSPVHRRSFLRVWLSAKMAKVTVPVGSTAASGPVTVAVKVEASGLVGAAQR